MNTKRFIAAAAACVLAGSTGALVQNSAPLSGGSYFTAAAADYTTVTQNNIEYHVYSDHAEVSKPADGFEGEAVILSEVSGVPVTRIQDKAFEECSTITSVTIPDSVTELGICIFSGCKNLTKAVVGNGVTSIPGQMFQECEALESVTLGDNIRQIGGKAFYRTGIVSLTMPVELTTVNASAFLMCTKLEKVKFNSKLTTLEDRAFEGCYALSDVEFPDSLRTIGSHCFYNCIKIDFVILGEHLNSVGEDAFFCKLNGGLKSLRIYNPECDIFRGRTTLHNPQVTVIYGAEGSTAKEYADEFGYTFKPISEAFTFGDFTGDGKINAADASNILARYASLATGGADLTEEELTSGDVNKDGRVNAFDASQILAYYAYKGGGGDHNLTDYLYYGF